MRIIPIVTVTKHVSLERVRGTQNRSSSPAHVMPSVSSAQSAVISQLVLGKIQLPYPYTLPRELSIFWQGKC